MSARTKVRRRALDVLFEADAKGVGSDPDALRALAAQRINQMVAQVTLPSYAVRMVRGVADHLPTIDAAISEFSRGWTLERMPPVDRAALRLGIWEIWCNDEVDAPVTIKEMVKIVGELSTDRSPGFVNGMLDAIAKAPRPDLSVTTRREPRLPDPPTWDDEPAAEVVAVRVPRLPDPPSWDDAETCDAAENTPDVSQGDEDDEIDELDAVDADWPEDAPMPAPAGMARPEDL